MKLNNESPVMAASNASQSLVSVAIQIASVGAAEYLRRHNLKASPEALRECLAAWVKIKLPEAMKDAKAALDSHMTQAAEATFKASLIAAGIEAAKEAGMPVAEVYEIPLLK